MNVPSPVHDDNDNGEQTFIDESDIINEYEIDEEELPDADDEGGSGGEEEFDGVDDSVHIFTGHTGELYSAACSPTDASLVATGGGDDKGFLWRIGQGDWIFELQGHQETVSGLSFSMDGQLIASGGLDGVVKVWDVAKEELKCTLEGPGAGIEWVRWHPKGHLVLAGAEDSSIWMWNADKGGAYLNVFSGHGGSVTCGDFTPDGKTICSGSDDATMKIWNPRNAEIIHDVRGHPYHTEGITCLTISSDSSLVITGSSDGSVHVVNISTGKVVLSLNAHTESVESVAFEPSSRRDSWRAATGGLDQKLIIWDQHSSPRCICEHEDTVTCLLWLAGSRYIATGCLDGKVRIWDSLSGDCAKVLSGHSDAIQSLAVSSNGEYLVSVSIDETARVFEIAEFR
ncbi:hypothetical protein SASPL_149538 [Salvia splendens]|uniref:Ribosome assembly protein SQT1 n=1 Tax=Salvia splendens TaxID=180675 RepID=A0A8X8WBC3_SALSN|nr:angio-associated migratory cell protein-like [Salvia splendens]KAG6391778.1 hypothetical protein SASPL_149538 [Salvia splendens]